MDAVNNIKVANEHFAAGRFEAALKGYKLLLEVSPEEAAIHMNIGAALRGLGRREEALQSLDKSLELDEGVAMAWWNKGLLLEDMDRLDEALTAFDKCIELDPENSMAIYQRVNLLNIRHRFGDAITAAQAALAKDQDNLMLHLELVLACINEHNKEVLILECDFLKAHEGELDDRGRQLYSLGLFEIANQLSSDEATRGKAIAYYDSAIAVHQSASMHFNKAVCCMSTKDYDSAEVRGSALAARSLPGLVLEC
jgi:tetratricopeptide (TPR) repeat protein